MTRPPAALAATLPLRNGAPTFSKSSQVRASMLLRILRRALGSARSLLADRRGEGDLMTSLLLTAAGAVMVAITVPSLFESSDSAARTFRAQVSVLERGATPTFAGSAGGSGWNISVGSGGVSVAGGNGKVQGNVTVGSGGRTGGSIGSSGGTRTGGGAGGTGTFPQPNNTGTTLSKNGGLIRDAILNP
jgi:hypothetical protein